MRGVHRLIAFFLILFLCACAAQPPRWRTEALTALDKAVAANADKLLPAEYNSAREALLRGEELLMEGEKDYAENFFLLALQKADLVRQEAKREETRLAEEAARRAEEERKTEAARLLALEEAAKAQAQKTVPVAPKPPAEIHHKPKPVKEQRLVATYTVRSGESLPLIAAQPEVYNDRNMWPLLYRANRDQIRDPRHIWPGQVLRIPRSVSRDDVTEARRYAQEKPLR